MKCRIRLAAGMAVLLALGSSGALGGLQFDRKGQVAFGDVFNVSEGTIEFWFKPATTRNNEWIVTKTKDAENEMTLGFGTVGLMHMVKNAGEWTYAWIPREEIAPGAWHHVACVFTANKAALFLDGVGYTKTMRPGPYGLDHLKGGSFFVGRGTNPAETYNGLIGEMRLSNAARYTSDFAPSAKPFAADEYTVALWRFDEASGEAVRDASGHQHDGVLSGPVARTREQPRLARSDDAGALPVLRTDAAPTVDGRLDEPCWKASSSAAGFLDVKGGGYVLAPRKTAVRAVYDDRALYLAAVCEEPEMDKLVAGVTTHDGPVFGDDCLEVFLDPANDRAAYYHLAFNALGAWYDGRVLDKTWNAKLTTAARRESDRWILEVAIPFAELGVAAPSEGDLWGFNAAREHRVASSVTFSTWAPLGDKGFHDAQRLGELIFAGKTIAEGLREVSNLKPSVRNPAFAEREKDGRPIAWTLGKATQIRETVYLAGIFSVSTNSDALMARQDMNFMNVAGKRFEFAVNARGEGDGRLGVTLHYAAGDGKAQKVNVLWDEPLGDDFKTVSKTAGLPADALRLTALEIYRSNGKGTVAVTSVAMSDASQRFDGVKEAADKFPEHRRAVGEPFASPGVVAWAHPLAGGAVRALFIVDRAPREVVELAQRVEIAYDVCWTDNEQCFAYGAKEINARLRREAQPYDAIVLAAPVRNVSLLRAIKENLRQGTGLLVIRRDEDASAFQGLADALPQPEDFAAARSALARSVPWQHMPAIPDNQIFTGGRGEPALKKIGVGVFEKGKAAQIVYGGPTALRGLLPRAANNPSDLDAWHEYVYGLIGKAVLAVSSRKPAAEIESLEFSDAKDVATVVVRGSETVEAIVKTRWEDTFGVVRGFDAAAPIRVPAGGMQSVTLPVPAEVRRANGLHTVRVILCDTAGKTLDWSAAAFKAESPLRLAAASPVKAQGYRKGERIEAPIQIENAGGEPASIALTVSLTDSYGRDVWTQETRLDVGARGTTAFVATPALDRCLTVYHVLRAVIRDAAGVRDAREWPVHLTDNWAWVWEDFRSGVNCDYFIRAHTDRTVAQWLQQMGFDYTTEGGVYDAGPRDNMPWLYFNAVWQPFHYFKKTPVREPCLNDPAVLRDTVEAGRSAVAGAMRSAPLSYNIGDECELTRDGGAEVCFCPRCAASFRDAMRRQYGDLATLNAEWETALRSWDEIAPITAAEARKRGAFAQWVDFRVFMEDTWVNAFKTVKDGVKQQYPDALWSFTNPFGLNPFSGSDHYKMSQVEDVFCKYFRTDLIKEYRSFKPGTPMITFYGYLESLPVCTYHPWWYAFNGGDFQVWWSTFGNAGYELFDAMGRATPRSRALVAAMADLKCGAGKILHDFPPIKDPVAMLYSQTSMHCAWIESEMPVGVVPWAEAGMSGLPASNPFGLHDRSLRNFKAMLKETALQPAMIAADQIVQGKLDEYRMLILPCASSLSEAALDRIAGFVRNGGTVVADLRTGLYTEHGRRVTSRAAFETLFGLRREDWKYDGSDVALAFEGAFAPVSAARSTDSPAGRERIALTTARALAKHRDGVPAVAVNALGRGRAVYLNFTPGAGPAAAALMRALLDLAGVERPVKLMQGDAPAFGYDCYLFERGPVRYLGVLRDMPPLKKGDRWSMFDASFRNAANAAETISLALPSPAHVYEVRSGKYLGKSAAFECEMPASEARLFALLPYAVSGVAIRNLQAAYKPGDAVTYEAVVAPAEGAAGDHVLRIEVVAPDGSVVTCHSRNILAPGGRFAGRIPLALNDAPGAWRLRVTEVASHRVATESFTVAP